MYYRLFYYKIVTVTVNKDIHVTDIRFCSLQFAKTLREGGGVMCREG